MLFENKNTQFLFDVVRFSFIFVPTLPESRRKGVKINSGVLWPRPSLCQHEDGGRRSMMGDSSKLLTHYHDDAKTMYEVFQRGLHISGGYYGKWGLSDFHTLSLIHLEILNK